MRKVLERDIEAYLNKRAKEAGFLSYKFTSPSRRSVPDRLICVPGEKTAWGTPVTAFVECKAPGKKPTEAQEREIKRLRDAGYRVFVCSAKNSVDHVIGMLLNVDF